MMQKLICQLFGGYNFLSLYLSMKTYILRSIMRLYYFQFTKLCKINGKNMQECVIITTAEKKSRRIFLSIFGPVICN